MGDFGKTVFDEAAGLFGAELGLDGFDGFGGGGGVEEDGFFLEFVLGPRQRSGSDVFALSLIPSNSMPRKMITPDSMIMWRHPSLLRTPCVIGRHVPR